MMRCRTMSGGGSVRVAESSFVDGAITMSIVFQSETSILLPVPRIMRHSAGVKYVIPKNNWYIIAENMLRVARESIVEERDGEWSDSVTAYLRDRGYDYGGPINTVLNLIRARLTREPSKKEQIEALKDLLYRDQSNEIWQPENHKEKPECFRAINYRILEAYRRGLQQAETRKP